MDTSVSDENAIQQDVTKLDRYRERFASWTTFAALLVFFAVTIAFWGWAVWNAGAYLVGLVL